MKNVMLIAVMLSLGEKLTGLQAISHTTETIQHASRWQQRLHWGKKNFPPVLNTYVEYDRPLTDLCNVSSIARWMGMTSMLILAAQKIESSVKNIGIRSLLNSSLGGVLMMSAIWNTILPAIELFRSNAMISCAAEANKRALSSMKFGDDIDRCAQSIQLVRQGPEIFNPQSYRELQTYITRGKVPGIHNEQDMLIKILRPEDCPQHISRAEKIKYYMAYNTIIKNFIQAKKVRYTKNMCESLQQLSACLVRGYIALHWHRHNRLVITPPAEMPCAVKQLGSILNTIDRLKILSHQDINITIINNMQYNLCAVMQLITFEQNRHERREDERHTLENIAPKP